MKNYERVYARVLGLLGGIGFALLVMATVLTVSGALAATVDAEDWPKIWVHPADRMSRLVVEDLAPFCGSLTAEEAGFLALGFFGLVTAVAMGAVIPAFVLARRWVYLGLAVCQLAVLALAVASTSF